MKPYEVWLLKAGNDLKSAKKLMEGDNKIPDTAIYHAQQSVEKSLKAYLSFKQQPIQKTHDVELLTELCIELNEKFNTLLEDTKSLSGYDIAFRYPDVILEPDEDDVIDAIEKAEKILLFVINIMKEESS